MSTFTMSNDTGGNTRRQYLAGAGMAMAASLAGCLDSIRGRGGSYPSDDVRWIVPFGPGGAFDTYSRQFAEVMPDHLPNDVSVGVDNVEGGGGQVGALEMWNAEPDGYTMGILHGPVHSGLQILEDPGYDMREFSWVGRVTETPHILIASSDSPYETLEDVQNADEQLKIGLTGTGHMFIVVPATGSLDLELDYVTGYEGSADASAAAMRGDIDLIQHSHTNETIAQGVQNGELRPILFYGDQADVPDYAEDVETAEELGYSEAAAVARSVRLVTAPPDMPEEELRILRDAFWETAQSDEIQEFVEQAGKGSEFRPLRGEETQELIPTIVDQFENLEDLIRENT